MPLARSRMLTAAATIALAAGHAAHAQPGPRNVRLVETARYSTGIYNASAAEIGAYDPATRRIFVTNAADNTLDFLHLQNIRRLSRVRQIDLSPWGANPNGVAAANGLVAVGVQADVVTDPGKVVFFSPMGQFRGAITVGALPDMVTFTPDGTKLLVANEGEPAGGVDPVGSVSIIDLSNGVASATVTTLGFEAWNGRENELRARGVRIFPGKTAAEDLEPEYIAVSADGTRAFVTLQEANAFAVINLENNTILDIVPLGLKDHSRGQPELETFTFTDLPVLGTTTLGQQILLGGFSGLWFEGIDPQTGRYKFVTHPDRGPNGEPTNVDGDPALERPFILPDYQARIIRFELDPATGALEFTQTILLTRADGATPITGLPNIPGVDEEPVDLFGQHLPYDPFGADLEGIVMDGAGNFWCVDEYRPAIYCFGPDGRMLSRYVPQGTGALGGQPAGTYGAETLPAVYSKRRPNRGFEAVAIEGSTLYAFIQTPLANPNTAASNASDVIRILAIDTTSGEPVGEYVYLLESPDLFDTKVDKIADAVSLGGGRFLVGERDDTFESYAKKLVFEINLRGATNLLAPDAPALLPGKTLEQHTPDQLAQAGVRPVNKVKAANLGPLGYTGVDKFEGMALLPDGRVVVINDNDFNIQPTQIAGDGTIPLRDPATPIKLGIVSFTKPSGLDASDRDDAINIRNWPVYGVFMPDSIASFQIGGRTYYITANEGDDRGETARVSALALDPVAFPNAASLRANANLGRLTVSTIDGDIDGDGHHDQLWAYGARSVSIWDHLGNLVADTGDLFEQLTAAASPADFNCDHVANGSFDTRSDNKGPEPEAVAVGAFMGSTYAFVGLERIGGVVTLDITDPASPRFVHYINSRDFSGDTEAGTARDLGAEGVLFVPAQDSPIGLPLVIVTNEVSGSTTVYRVTPAGRAVDFDFDGRATSSDISAFITTWLHRDPEADFNEDGRINADDISAFITAWLAAV